MEASLRRREYFALGGIRGINWGPCRAKGSFSILGRCCGRSEESEERESVWINGENLFRIGISDIGTRGAVSSRPFVGTSPSDGAPATARPQAPPYHAPKDAT